MRVVVNQPTYIPWMGYFAMIDIADVFVFYDDVQFSVQSWQQRNRIKTGNGTQWLTVPIKKDFGQRICDVRIDTDQIWRKKHWKSIEQAYSSAPCFSEYGAYLTDIYDVYWLKLSDFNIYAIRWISELLDIRQPLWKRSSDIQTEGNKTDRLLPILREVGCSEYISGLAAKNYLDVEKLESEGIKVKWFDYEHPAYPQIRGEFISHLSVIDLILNNGKESINYIRGGGDPIR